MHIRDNISNSSIMAREATMVAVVDMEVEVDKEVNNTKGVVVP